MRSASDGDEERPPRKVRTPVTSAARPRRRPHKPSATRTCRRSIANPWRPKWAQCLGWSRRSWMCEVRRAETAARSGRSPSEGKLSLYAEVAFVKPKKSRLGRDPISRDRFDCIPTAPGGLSVVSRLLSQTPDSISNARASASVSGASGAGGLGPAAHLGRELDPMTRSRLLEPRATDVSSGPPVRVKSRHHVAWALVAGGPAPRAGPSRTVIPRGRSAPASSMAGRHNGPVARLIQMHQPIRARSGLVRRGRRSGQQPLRVVPSDLLLRGGIEPERGEPELGHARVLEREIGAEQHPLRTEPVEQALLA